MQVLREPSKKIKEKSHIVKQVEYIKKYISEVWVAIITIESYDILQFLE